jgi:hypothetical protein
MVIHLQRLILATLLGFGIPTISLSLSNTVLAGFMNEEPLIVEQVLYPCYILESVRGIGSYFHPYAGVLFALGF